MLKSARKRQVLALFTITFVLLIAASPNIANVKAQEQATVNVLDSIGGTTTPVNGTYNYDDGASDTFTATASDGFVFLYWIIGTNAGANTVIDNPTTLTFTGGVTYDIQPIFQAFNATYPPVFARPFNAANYAIIVLVGGIGGNTTPAPGIYALANASTFQITANPSSGWQFSHWVISGGPLTSHGGFSVTDTPTNNPYTVGHGYGYTYDYQPVFTPISTSTSPSPSVAEFSANTAIILVAILAIALLGTIAYRKNNKK